MASPVFPHGTQDFAVANAYKIAATSETAYTIYKQVGYPNVPDTWDLFYAAAAGETYLSAAQTADETFRIEAGAAKVYYALGTAPSISTPVAALTGSADPFPLAGLNAAQGGAISVTGGSSTAGNAGGAASILGGVPGVTGAGGAVSVTGGAGGATSGTGGAATLTGGVGTAGNAVGGAATVAAGAGQGTGAGAVASMTGGASGAGATGNGGVASVTGGAAASTNGAGGAVSATGGAGAGTGAGGAASMTGGASGSGATGNGGVASVVGGAAASTNGNGGNVVLTPGALAGTGLAGMSVIHGVPVVDQGAPNAQTTAATLTIANLLTGIVTGTHTAGATQAYTLPTGTLSDAGVQMAADEAFEWTLINLSAAAADTITVTAGVGHTLVGEGIVQSAHASTGLLYGSSGRFRTRKTAANTFVTYRVG